MVANGGIEHLTEPQCRRSPRVGELLIEFQDIFTVKSYRYGTPI
jgi:hypothetical protein